MVPAEGDYLRDLIVRLAERSADVIYRYRVGVDPGFDYISPAIERLTGYAPEEYYADPDLSIRTIHPDDRDWAEQALRSPLEHEGRATVRLIRKDGEVVWVERSNRVVCDDSGGPVAVEGVARDISDRARVEEELRGREATVRGLFEDVTERRRLKELSQSQKMEAVGRLAGGVAHDFNNQLAAIRLYCDLVLAHADDPKRVRGEVEGIMRVAELAGQLTAQLLAFGRKQVMQARVLDVNVVVAHAEQMLRHLLGSGVVLETELSPSLAPVQADPAQLERVIVNLALNARDAMTDGGTLTILTANVEREGEPRVLLQVSDTGIGMDEATRARLFEPFFTTKGTGEGTGLGLAAVYGVVTQSGGTIEVESEPGEGSTFSIHLPRSEAAVEAGHPEEDTPVPAGRSETLLLVEDEEAVRAVTAEMLEDAGYRVVAAAHGAEGLELAEALEGGLDAVVTDVLMPGMSGPEVVERLRERFPDLRVVFMSGYPDPEAISAARLSGPTAFVQKPFSIEELARAIRAVLGVGG